MGLLLGSAIQLLYPFLTKSIIDTGVNTSNLNFITIVLIAQLALFFSRTVVDFIKSWILLHISIRINLSLLTDFLIKLMKLPIGFFDSKQTGDILQRMNDQSRIQNFLTGNSLSTLFSLFNLVVFAFVLGNYHFPIFIIVLSASVIYTLWIIIFLKQRKNLDYQQFTINSQEQTAIMQLVQGMQEIKLQGAEKIKRWEWENIKAKDFKLDYKSLAINQWQNAGALFINEGKNILITFMAAKGDIDGQITLGEMMAIQYIVGQLNSPIEQLLGFVQSYQLAKISIDRLNEIHKMDDEEKETDYQYNAVKPMGIEINNLSFTYKGAGNEPVLKNINIQIPAGKTTAIVGTSGSGKTTLLKLLLRFYQAESGNIYLQPKESDDRIDFNLFSPKSWRLQLGVVMQESFIFNDSIAKNIAVADESPNKEKLNHAVEVANVKTYIESLPLGYNTKLGADGKGLSAGQKQRILIARAVYRNPNFIFFDEATNNLDANNETIIYKNLETFFKGRTTVIVAHRLSTVKNADQIIVLNNGMVTEKGTHNELIMQQGEYYTLVKNQLEL